MTPALLRSPVFWFRLVSLIVVVSLALGIARLTWRLVGWDDGRTAVWTPAALAPVGGATGSHLASIITWAPFGGGSAGDLSVSSLGLILRGVVYAAGGGSTALISSGPGPVQIFVVGQAPAGNAVIESIEVDRVILNVGGQLEALVLPNPAGGSPVGTAAAAVVPTASAAPSPEAAAALASASPIATAAAAASRNTAGAPRAPAGAVGSLGVTPTPQGYVVGADSAPQLLRAGVLPGDVIKSLNGQALGDPARDQQILQRAAAGSRARVEIVRNGRTLTFTVPLR